MDTAALRKILELERQRGCADTAVIGGLDRFLANWTAANAGSLSNKSAVTRFQTLFTPNYAGLTPAQRSEWIERVFAWLDVPATAPPAAEKPKRPAAPARRKPTSKPKKEPSVTAVKALESPVTVVRGISDALAARFKKLGVQTVRDLLYFFPHRHLDYSQLKTIAGLRPGEEQTVVANVWEAKETRPGGRKSTEAIVGDSSGNMRVVWFNQPYLARTLKTNSRIVLSGRVSVFREQPVFQSPEWEFEERQDTVHTGRLVPVYPLTAGLRPRQVRKLMKGFIDLWAPQLPEFLPDTLKRRLDLLDLPAAVAQAHYPDDAALKDRARVRLAFDELFLLQLGVMSKKREWRENRPGTPLDTSVPVLDAFLESLPYTLTAAQQRVLQEILADLAGPLPMSRLLQGEVGSGKTVIATAALLTAVGNGCQAAFMAPTEILAEQHFLTITGLLRALGEEEGEGYVRTYTGILDRPVTAALLVGDIKQKGKKGLRQQIESGGVDIVIGTHALVQKDVAFDRLGFAIVDEQHRFGVEQRAALRDKGFNPHMLVMTATPIPRTLALTLYGDLDLSVIDELPPGRQTIKTKWLRPNQRQAAYGFVRKQVGEGRQAFILCPLVEESDAVAAQAAVAEHERLSGEVFPDLRLGLLHGRMKAADKDAVMAAFRAGELDVLVSTPVIEVGIDIPNATVMLIESADRFGLSQLHQFRGRVGRGEHQSYCMLLAENPSEVGRARLDIIENTRDGFKLAEEDLKLRGPGEFFGTRQSGLPDLRMAKISDVALLEKARDEAVRLFQADPELTSGEHRALRAEMVRVWRGAGEWS
jgi:ATP-dependent DNA helicase RecG